MYLYCGRSHGLFEREDSTISDEEIRASRYAGLGYHSPNMKVGHSLGMVRSANAFDQEGIATLVMSGRYLGHLPDHYAQSFVDAGRIRMLGGETFRYDCEFSAILRRAPKPSRVVATFVECMLHTHGAAAGGDPA
jgi:DNA-binding transcriptional LysR family regulator